jgi:hypothetical protein
MGGHAIKVGPAGTSLREIGQLGLVETLHHRAWVIVAGAGGSAGNSGDLCNRVSRVACTGQDGLSVERSRRIVRSASSRCLADFSHAGSRSTRLIVPR